MAMLGLGLAAPALTESAAAVIRPLVTVAAGGLGVAAAPSVSRRAAASITQFTGVSAGTPGELPADGLHNGASKLPIAVVMTLTGSGGAAVAVVAASLTPPTGSDADTAAAPDCAFVAELSVCDAFVAVAVGAGVERASLSGPS
jgi:hypothetical protein